MKFNCSNCEHEFDTSDLDCYSKGTSEVQCECGEWVKVPEYERDWDAEAKDMVYDSQLGVSFEVIKGGGKLKRR